MTTPHGYLMGDLGPAPVNTPVPAAPAPVAQPALRPASAAPPRPTSASTAVHATPARDPDVGLAFLALALTLTFAGLGGLLGLHLQSQTERLRTQSFDLRTVPGWYTSEALEPLDGATDLIVTRQALTPVGGPHWNRTTRGQWTLILLASEPTFTSCTEMPLALLMTHPDVLAVHRSWTGTADVHVLAEQAVRRTWLVVTTCPNLANGWESEASGWATGAFDVELDVTQRGARLGPPAGLDALADLLVQGTGLSLGVLPALWLYGTTESWARGLWHVRGRRLAAWLHPRDGRGRRATWAVAGGMPGLGMLLGAAGATPRMVGLSPLAATGSLFTSPAACCLVPLFAVVAVIGYLALLSQVLSDRRRLRHRVTTVRAGVTLVPSQPLR